MFEAVIAVCLTLSAGPCRDQVVPGFEAATRAECEAALAARAPDADAVPACKPVGAALSFQEVAPGVFVHMGQVAEPDANNRGDVSNVGFIIGQTHVAVIDTGSARWMGDGIWRAVRARTDKPVSHVILTHMHPDHVLGAGVFAEAGAQVVGHAALPRALADRQQNYVESLSRLVGQGAFLGTDIVPIDVLVDGTTHIDLGDREVRVQAWPASHTGTDITVEDVTTQTLFTGDLVFHRHTPALDGKLRGWQSVMTDLAALDVARIVPGHGGPVLDWPMGAEAMQRYLNVLAADTVAAIHSGQRLGDAVQVIAQSEAENWELFEAYNPRNATVAFTELEWE